MEDTVFAKLSDDVVLNIFFKLEDDPRNWARVACVSTKFSSLIRTVCWRNKCTTTIPSVVSDLLSSATATSPPGGWAALHKLAVCCPGLLHSGVLLENSDFGLERELGPDETFRNSLTFNNNNNTDTNTNNTPQTHEASSSSNSCSWSLFDDLYLDTVYDVPGSTEGTINPADAVENSNSVGVGVGVGVGTEYSVVSKRRETEGTMNPVDAVENSNSVGVGVGVGTEYSVVSKRRKTEGTMNPVDAVENSNSVGVGVIKVGTEYSVVSKRRKTESTMNPVDAVDNSNSVGVGVVKVGTKYSGVSKRRKKCRSMRSHLASGVWNLSREQGSKLLARQFRDDCLYICDWPGCVHIEDKRNYMLFRGIFKNFKRSRVWRTINDGNRSRVDLNCAFCECKQTWDLHSAFCLRRFFGYHDDGEPVVRAYVCENGHVSGAWTDWPLYT